MTDENPIDRRQFAKFLTAATGSSAIMFATAANSSAADEVSKDISKTENGSTQKSDVAQPKPLSQEILLLKILLDRYPSDHFDEAAIRGIVSDLRSDMARGRVLSEFGLKNSDEPFPGFRAYRGPK